MSINEVKVPTTRFRNIERILHALKAKELPRKEIAEKAGLSKSLVSTTLPFMRSLSLITTSDYRLVRLTNEGNYLAHALSQGDLKPVRPLIETIVSQSPVLTYALQIISSNPNVSSLDIGKALANKFGWEWDSKATYRNVGKASIDILAGLELIPRLWMKRHRMRSLRSPRTGTLRPTAPIDMLLNILDRLDHKEYREFFLSNDNDKMRLRTNDRARSLIDLRLVDVLDNGLVRLTDRGNEIKLERRAGNDSAVSKLLSEVLLNDPNCREIIGLLVSLGISVGYLEVGATLMEYNGAVWGIATSKVYGSRFLGWLKMANIAVPNSKYGKYRIIYKPNGLQERTPDLPQERQMQRLETDEAMPLVEALQEFILKAGEVLLRKNGNWLEDKTAVESIRSASRSIVEKAPKDGPYSRMVSSISRLIDEGMSTGVLGYVHQAVLVAYDMVGELQMTKEIRNAGVAQR